MTLIIGVQIAGHDLGVARRGLYYIVVGYLQTNIAESYQSIKYQLLRMPIL